ncbi:MerR family DNA-binding transcriptional regulator [Fusobacterium sp. MFO224]|uniref:MerR family DNA-binding transcriptional regulator n=1 Tax=Fusobacterium sp. MFO224 TaxID=3378070 RepID=UPI003854C80A
MNENNKNFLSIGQVANLKGISVKSLRYYEKLGILIPKYINEETGYRYYTIEQMIIVDLIINCIYLDIPLKNFHNYYMEDKFLNVKKLLKDGIEIANKKKAKLDKTLKDLNYLANHLKTTEKIKKHKGSYESFYQKRFFITCEWSGDIYNLKEFIKKITDLYKQCEKFNLESKFNQGIMVINKKNIIKKLVFLEISKNTKNIENLIVIPEGNFNCEIFDYDKLPVIQSKYLEKLIPSTQGIFIFRELYDNYVDYNPTPLEVQFYIKGANK